MRSRSLSRRLTASFVMSWSIFQFGQCLVSFYVPLTWLFQCRTFIYLAIDERPSFALQSEVEYSSTKRWPPAFISGKGYSLHSARKFRRNVTPSSFDLRDVRGDWATKAASRLLLWLEPPSLAHPLLTSKSLILELYAIRPDGLLKANTGTLSRGVPWG